MNVYEVQSLSKVKVMNYKNGDIFITNRSIAILANDELVPLATMKDVQSLRKEVIKNDKTK